MCVSAQHVGHMTLGGNGLQHHYHLSESEDSY